MEKKIYGYVVERTNGDCETIVTATREEAIAMAREDWERFTASEKKGNRIYAGMHIVNESEDREYLLSIGIEEDEINFDFEEIQRDLICCCVTEIFWDSDEIGKKRFFLAGTECEPVILDESTTEKAALEEFKAFAENGKNAFSALGYADFQELSLNLKGLAEKLLKYNENAFAAYGKKNERTIIVLPPVAVDYCEIRFDGKDFLDFAETEEEKEELESLEYIVSVYNGFDEILPNTVESLIVIEKSECGRWPSVVARLWESNYEKESLNLSNGLEKHIVDSLPTLIRKAAWEKIDISNIDGLMEAMEEDGSVVFFSDEK